MAPLGWSGGSQFSSTVLDVVFPAVASMRGEVGAEGKVLNALHWERKNECIYYSWLWLNRLNETRDVYQCSPCLHAIC